MCSLSLIGVLGCDCDKNFLLRRELYIWGMGSMTFREWLELRGIPYQVRDEDGSEAFLVADEFLMEYSEEVKLLFPGFRFFCELLHEDPVVPGEVVLPQ